MQLQKDDATTQEKVARPACACGNSTPPTRQSWFWSVFVVVCFATQVVMNILAGEEFGSFGGGSNTELSEQNPTFLTPDGMTFSVWGIIYLFQGIFTVYQVIPCFQNHYERLAKARFWACALFLANSLWLPLFSNRLWFLAFLFMIVMDVALIQLYRELRINYGAADDDQKSADMLPLVLLSGGQDLPKGPQAASWQTKVFVFVGFSTNLAWLSVASMVNLLVALGNSGWGVAYTVMANTTSSGMTSTEVQVFGNVDFTIMGISLVAMLAVVLAIRNCDVPFALVAMWALWGVYRAQAVKPSAGYPLDAMQPAIADWALGLIVTIGIAVVIGLAKAIFETVCAHRRVSQHAAAKEQV